MLSDHSGETASCQQIIFPHDTQYRFMVHNRPHFSQQPDFNPPVAIGFSCAPLTLADQIRNSGVLIWMVDAM